MKLPKPVKLFLTVLLTTLSAGCAQNFPTLHPHILSLKAGKCAVYKEISIDPLSFKFIEWVPIKTCEGFIAFPPSDIANVRAWYDSERKSRED